MQSTVNERLKILMEELGLNPNSLSRILGISPSTLRNYTERESKPGYDVLEKLYHSFKHINLPWLFGEPGAPLLSTAAELGVSYQVLKKNKGNTAGVNTGTMSQQVGTDANLKRELDMAQQTIVQLQSQLRDKDHIIELYQRATK